MNEEKPRKILGIPLIDAIAAAIGAPAGSVQKIIVEAPYNSAVKVYVQYVGDTRLLSIDWNAELRDMEVTALGEPGKEREGFL